MRDASYKPPSHAILLAFSSGLFFCTVTVAIVALENLFFYFYFLPYRIIFSYATIATIKKNIEIIKEIISTDRHSVLLSNAEHGQ